MTIQLTTCKPIKSPATRRALMNVAASLLKESDIEQTCSDFLALDGWRSLKTDPVSRKEWGKGFGELGMADRLYIRYLLDPATLSAERCRQELRRHADVMWIEWKSRKGRPSQRQKDWHSEETLRGALTLIAGFDFPASIEGFQAWYRASGLMRRKI